MDVEVGDSDFQLAHGGSKFLKSERVGKLQREQCLGLGAEPLLDYDLC